MGSVLTHTATQLNSTVSWLLAVKGIIMDWKWKTNWRKYRTRMSDLLILKRCFDKIGITFLEETINGYTYVVMVNPNDAKRKINLKSDKFLEFDARGNLASY
jgi:hypothetical protein